MQCYQNRTGIGTAMSRGAGLILPERNATEELQDQRWKARARSTSMAQAMADTSTSRTAPLRHTGRIAADSAFSAASAPPPATEPSDPNRESDRCAPAPNWLGRVGSGRFSAYLCFASPSLLLLLRRSRARRR